MHRIHFLSAMFAALCAFSGCRTTVAEWIEIQDMGSWDTSTPFDSSAEALSKFEVGTTTIEQATEILGRGPYSLGFTRDGSLRVLWRYRVPDEDVGFGQKLDAALAPVFLGALGEDDPYTRDLGLIFERTAESEPFVFKHVYLTTRIEIPEGMPVGLGRAIPPR